MKQSISKSLKFCLLIIITLGILLRFVNLDQKSYWIDEAFSSLRISGHLESEVAIQQLFDGRVITVQDLEKYQRPDPETNLIDTITSIRKEEATSTPLFFVLARLWNQWFGGSVATSRSLSAFLSVLVLPVFYWFCLELFESSLVAWVSVSLLAISPFQLLYASQFRPYSIWILATFLSSATLLRAMRRQTISSWGTYVLSITVGVYSHLFFSLIPISQGIFVILSEKFRLTKTFISYVIASFISLLLFLPWMIIIPTYLKNTLQYVPKFTGFTPISLLKTWLLNISRIFIDFNQCFPEIKVIPCYVTSPYNQFVLLSIIPLTLLVGYSFYFIYRHGSKKACLFVFTLTGFTGIALIIPDILFEVQRSIVIRYAIACILGINLAVGYCLATNMSSQDLKVWQQKFWQGVTVLLIVTGVISCVMISQSKFWWDRGYNYHYEIVANVINQAKKPLLIYAMPSSYLSPKIGAFARGAVFAHNIDSPKAKLQFITDNNDNPQINFEDFTDIFVYRMNSKLKNYLENKNYSLEPVAKHSMNKKTVLRKLSKNGI